MLVIKNMFANTASKIASKVISENFSNSFFIKANSFSKFKFYCEFVFLSDVSETAFSFIESKIKDEINKKNPIKTFEMMSKVAEKFLDKKLKTAPGELIKLMQIEDFADICKDSILKNTFDLKAFKLLEFRKSNKKYNINGSERESFYLIGAAAKSSSELKSLLKKINSYKKTNHIYLGESLNLFKIIKNEEKSFCFFYPRGEKIRYKLLEFLRKKYEENGFQFVSYPSFFKSNVLKLNKISKFNFVKKESNDEISSNLTNLNIYLEDSAAIFCDKEDLFKEVIFSINFITNILKNFKIIFTVELIFNKKNYEFGIFKKALDFSNFEYLIKKNVLSSETVKIIFNIEDFLERTHELSFISCKLLNEKYYLKFSVFNSIERFIAIILENSEGNLPLCISPETVRIITIKKNNIEYAKNILKKINCFDAFIDMEDISLNEKVYRALKMKIPYIILIGDKEEKSKNITLRSNKSNIAYNMEIEEFIQILYEKKIKI